MKRVVILGSSGSIGQSALRAARSNPGWSIAGLAVYGSVDSLMRDAKEFGVKDIAVGDKAKADALEGSLPPGTRLYKGMEGVCALAADVEADIVLCAIVGMAGLGPVLSAIKAGRDVALATKEVLVAAGELVMKERERHGVAMLPVDSEHSAIFQSLQSGGAMPYCVRNADDEGKIEDDVSRIILTASGGPFFFRPDTDFDRVRVEEALAHPTWSMGRKISIDSATMVNKGLEIIEARWLFNVPPGKIEVLVHPESVIHSIVEFSDRAQIAELSEPDMMLAINYALSWPARTPLGAMKPLDLAARGKLTFHAADEKRFASLALAREALGIGGNAPLALNSANEVAVGAFLERRIRFSDICRVISAVLSSSEIFTPASLEEIHAADVAARRMANEAISRLR